MANYCRNQITFSGPHKDLIALFYHTGSSECPLNFNKIYPATEAENQSDMWGTRCLIDHHDAGIMRKKFGEFLEGEYGEISFSFNTNWDPPRGIYGKIGDIIEKNGLAIHIKGLYVEHGMQMFGEFDYKEGVWEVEDKPELFGNIHISIEISSGSAEDISAFEEILSEQSCVVERSGNTFKITENEECIEDFSESVKTAIEGSDLEIIGKICYVGHKALIESLYGDDEWEFDNSPSLEQDQC